MNTDGDRKENRDKDGNDPETYAVIGAAMEVHRQIGHGFLEAVYHEALCVELGERGVLFRREVDIPVRYKGRTLACTYRADLVCFDSLLVELKAISELTPREHSQVINYLRATGFTRGLLFNFGSPRLDYKRLIMTPTAVKDVTPSPTDS